MAIMAGLLGFRVSKRARPLLGVADVLLRGIRDFAVHGFDLDRADQLLHKIFRQIEIDSHGGAPW
jgi:Holliday junction resolvasome RuvABC ATP-dependent DNA helicase subunit